MTDSQYMELSAKMQVLFEQYGVVAFGGILFEADSGAVVSGNRATDDPAMVHRCEVLDHALKRLAREVFFVYTDGVLRFST